MAYARDSASAKQVKTKPFRAASEPVLNDIIRKISDLHKSLDKKLSQIVELCDRKKCNE